MSKTPQWIGIDVSQETLDVYIRPLGKAMQISNSQIEIAKLVKFFQGYLIERVVVEATGKLESELVLQLQESQFPVSLINPRQGRDFAKATGHLAKTDAIDAKTLAHYGEAMKPMLLASSSPESRQLRELMSRRRQLIEMQTAEKNRRSRARGKALEDIEAHLDYLNQRLEQLNRDIEQLTQSCSEWTEKVELLKTMPGIGPAISTTLVSDLPELGQLSAKKIARLVGVAPLNFDSGKYKGQRKIQGGRAAIRAILYMGAVVAMRHNPAIKVFYERLVKKGKPKKLALTACMRKLLVMLNAMVRDNRPWQYSITPVAHT